MFWQSGNKSFPLKNGNFLSKKKKKSDFFDEKQRNVDF